MLPKSKNIAKTLYHRSKSHFSHIRNEVEKVTLRPIILERFLDPNSTQDREKVVSKSLQKSLRFLIRFFIDFGSILDPPGPQNSTFFIIFCSWCHSWAILAPRGRPKCSKTAPELDFPRNLVHFGVNFRRIS